MDTVAWDDMKLWDRVRSFSDEQAFAVIYSRYSRTLYFIAYNKVRDMHLSEDIVQDVFTALWVKRETAPVTDLKGYLCLGTIFASLNHLRKSRLQLSSLTSAEELSDLSASGKAEHRYDDKYFAQLVKEAAASLPPKCRLVFQYKETGGYKNTEIASHLALSPKTVEYHLTKARDQLRKAFNILPLCSMFLHFTYFL